MSRWSIILIGAVVTGLWAGAPTQTLGVQSQTQGSVSADLLKLYRKTETASTIPEYTQLVDFCQVVVDDRGRSESDRTYAKQLLAWAANRRGELRSDEAGELVTANQLIDAEKLDKLATNDFKLALRHDPTRWKARHNLAISLAMNKDIPGAIQAFTDVIGQNPKYANAFFNRGELYFQTQKYDLAIEDYTAAIAIAPQDPLLYSSRGHVRFLQSQFDIAIADYKKASELAPTSVELATDWADACQSLYRWKEAAEVYRRALKIDATYARALQNASWMMATCPEEFYRDPKTALVAAQRAITNSKETSRTLDTLAAAHAANGDFVKAQTSARRAVEIATADDKPEIRARLDLYAKKHSYVQTTSTAPDKSANAIRPSTTAVGTGALGPR